jgi:hypothetical protein
MATVSRHGITITGRDTRLASVFVLVHISDCPARAPSSIVYKLFAVIYTVVVSHYYQRL